MPYEVKASELAKILQNTAHVAADLQARLNAVNDILSELAANLGEFNASFELAKEDPVVGSITREFRDGTVWPPAAGRVC